jgi:hypothetical protein
LVEEGKTSVEAAGASALGSSTGCVSAADPAAGAAGNVPGAVQPVRRASIKISDVRRIKKVDFIDPTIKISAWESIPRLISSQTC